MTWTRGRVLESKTTYRKETGTASRSVAMSGGQEGTEYYNYVEHIPTHKFWIQTPEGEQSYWVVGDHVPVNAGDTVTAFMHGDQFLGYVKHGKREHDRTFPDALMARAAERPSLWMTIFTVAAAAACIELLLTALLMLLEASASKSVLHPLYNILYAVGLIVGAWVGVWAVLYPVRYVMYVRRRSSIEKMIEAGLASSLKKAG